MALSEMGIDEVIVFCVNDAAVMTAWAAAQGIDSKGIITFMGDTRGELTKALGMELTHAGPCGVLGAGRCKRFSAFVEEVTFHFLAVMPRVKRFVVVDVDVDVVFGAVLSHELFCGRG